MQKAAGATRSCRRRLQGGVKQSRKAEVLSQLEWTLTPDDVHAGCSSAPSHGWAPLPVSPPVFPDSGEEPRAVRIVPDLGLGLGSGSHRDPTDTACPCPHSTRCSTPFWPASCLLSAEIIFLTPMQLIQNISIWCWSRFHFPDKGCSAQGLRVCSTPVLWRDCWLYTNIISYLASLKQTQMSLKGYMIYVH